MKHLIYAVTFSLCAINIFATESIVTNSKPITEKATASTTISTTNKTKPAAGYSSIEISPSVVCDVNSPCFIIKDTSTKVLGAINSGASPTKVNNLIKAVVITQFDFKLMTRMALGNNWKVASNNQKDKLVATFKDLLIITYASALSKFKGAQIRVNKEEILSPKRASVMTQVALPNSPANTQPINVEYYLAKTGENGAWLAYDIKIENASLVTTYRNQFNDIIQSNIIQSRGIDSLIKQLNTKVTNLQKNKS